MPYQLLNPRKVTREGTRIDVNAMTSGVLSPAQSNTGGGVAPRNTRQTAVCDPGRVVKGGNNVLERSARPPELPLELNLVCVAAVCRLIGSAGRVPDNDHAICKIYPTVSRERRAWRGSTHRRRLTRSVRLRNHVNLRGVSNRRAETHRSG